MLNLFTCMSGLKEFRVLDSQIREACRVTSAYATDLRGELQFDSS